MILRNTIYVAVVALSLVGSGLASDVAAQAVAGPLAQADVPDSPVSKVAPKKPHLAKTKIARAKAEKPKPAALEPWAAVDPGRVAPTPPPEAPLPPVDAKDEEFAKLIRQVQDGFEDGVLAQYLARVQGEIGVRVNQRALQSALGDSGS